MTDARARFDRPIFRRLRELCLALPETRETRSWGHPNFRVGTKTFCTLEVVQKASLDCFSRSAGRRHSTQAEEAFFFATPYGRGVWISRWLDEAIEWRALAALIARSHRYMLSK